MIPSSSWARSLAKRISGKPHSCGERVWGVGESPLSLTTNPLPHGARDFPDNH
jgi:hypothetical protein